MKVLISIFGCFLMMLFLCIGAVSANADDETVKDKNKELSPGPGEVFMNIGEVVVTAKSEAKKRVDLPGSVDVIGKEQLEKEITSNSLELLRRIPGFAFHDYGNGGVPNGFTMRGFNSNHGSDNLVLIDGIPINDHFWQEDGAPDMNQLTSEEVERIEVIKGPIDARYGNWARAGIVNIETRTHGDFVKSILNAGSWNTNKAYVSAGSEAFDDRFSQVYSVEYFSSDGWREKSEQERQNAYAKWYYRTEENLELGLQTHLYKADWSTGSYIDQQQWEEDRRKAFDASQDDGGKKELSEVSLHLNWNDGGTLPIETRAWFKDNAASRFADWGSGQTESFTAESVIGLLTNAAYKKNFEENSSLRFDAGFDWRNFDSHVQQWQTQARSRQALNADNDYLFNNLGLYGKVNYDPMQYLRLFGGVRYDHFSGDTEDRLTGEKRDMDDYDLTTYKAGIIGNISSRYSLYANLGTAYTLPKKSDKYLENHVDIKDLFFWEIGLKANPVDWVLMRYAFYNSEEDVYREVMGEYVNEGDAVRKGHEVEVSLLPIDSIEIFSCLTMDHSTYDGGENDGNWITAVPEYIWKVGLQYDSSFGTGVRIWYADIGSWYTDAANDHSYGGYQTTDLTLYHHFAEKWTLSLDIKNLFDEKYAEFVGYWSDSNQYMSSNPTAFYLSLRSEF